MSSRSQQDFATIKNNANFTQHIVIYINNAILQHIFIFSVALVTCMYIITTSPDQRHKSMNSSVTYDTQFNLPQQNLCIQKGTDILEKTFQQDQNNKQHNRNAYSRNTCQLYINLKQLVALREHANIPETSSILSYS